MAHKITMKQPKDIVLNRDVDFVVYKGRRKLGTLKVSKGSIDWIPSNGRIIRYMSWEHFALLMESRHEVSVK